jgi:hypothetical protein
VVREWSVMWPCVRTFVLIIDESYLDDKAVRCT